MLSTQIISLVVNLLVTPILLNASQVRLRNRVDYSPCSDHVHSITSLSNSLWSLFIINPSNSLFSFYLNAFYHHFSNPFYPRCNVSNLRRHPHNLYKHLFLNLIPPTYQTYFRCLYKATHGLFASHTCGIFQMMSMLNMLKRERKRKVGWKRNRDVSAAKNAGVVAVGMRKRTRNMMISVLRIRMRGLRWVGRGGFGGEW